MWEEGFEVVANHLIRWDERAVAGVELLEEVDASGLRGGACGAAARCAAAGRAAWRLSGDYDAGLLGR